MSRFVFILHLLFNIRTNNMFWTYKRIHKIPYLIIVDIGIYSLKNNKYSLLEFSEKKMQSWPSHFDICDQQLCGEKRCTFGFRERSISSSELDKGSSNTYSLRLSLQKHANPQTSASAAHFTKKTDSEFCFPHLLRPHAHAPSPPPQTFSIRLAALSKTSRLPHQRDQSNHRRRRTQERKSQIQLVETELRPAAHRSQLEGLFSSWMPNRSLIFPQLIPNASNGQTVWH